MFGLVLPRLMAGAAVALALAAAAPAGAENGRNAAAAVGAVGGFVAGAAIAGALAPRPVIVAPVAPVTVYEAPGPVCREKWRRTWVEGFGWTRRRIEVCE